MTRLRPADRAWLGLAGLIILYEVAADEGELLSEAADRYMLAHPWITRFVAFSIAAHLCNLVKDRYDPLHWLFTAKRLLRHQ